MVREKRAWFRRLLPLVLVMALLLPMSPVTMVEEVQAVTQADIDKLKKESQNLATQRAEVQEKLAQARAQKSELTEQKRLLEDDIDLIQQTIASIQDRIDGIQSQIESIQSEIDSLQKQIQEKDSQIAGYEEQIAVKQKELEETEAKEARLYDLFCRRVRLMEEQGEVSYWSILFTSDSFADLLDNFMMIQEFMEYDNEIMDELEALRTKIQEEKAELERIKADLEQARSELEQAKAAQEAARKEQEAAKQEQETAKQEQIAAQEELQAQEAEVDRLLSEITVTEQELEAQEAELSRAAGAADSEIRRMEQELSPQISSVKAEGSFAWPLPGRTLLTSLFGGRTDPITGRPGNHTGIDIPAPKNTPIHCAKSGVVTVSCKGSGGNWSYGNYVVVSHSDGTSTLYAHMNSRAVSVGQTVSQGAILGYVGTTGRSTGYHLHFEVRVNGSRTDPSRYFSGLSYRRNGRTVRLN